MTATDLEAALLAQGLSRESIDRAIETHEMDERIAYSDRIVDDEMERCLVSLGPDPAPHSSPSDAVVFAGYRRQVIAQGVKLTLDRARQVLSSWSEECQRYDANPEPEYVGDAGAYRQVRIARAVIRALDTAQRRCRRSWDSGCGLRVQEAAS